jgi:hypothetical protein
MPAMTPLVVQAMPLSTCTPTTVAGLSYAVRLLSAQVRPATCRAPVLVGADRC